MSNVLDVTIGKGIGVVAAFDLISNACRQTRAGFILTRVLGAVDSRSQYAWLIPHIRSLGKTNKMAG